MRKTLSMLAVLAFAAGGCNDPSFDLSACPNPVTAPLDQEFSLLITINAGHDQVINLALEQVPLDLDVQLDPYQGQLHRTLTVTCLSAGDFFFMVKASEPMSLLSNSESVTVHCQAGAQLPNFTACYDYTPTH